jgi:hypothetical protein
MICASGVSALKAGFPHSVVVDNAYVKSLLPAALSWLYDYLPFMHGLQIGDADAFCSVDPPSFTVPSGADIYAFVTGGPLSQVQAVNQFLIDITEYYLWFGLCECTSVVTPAPAAAPAAPSDLPAVNPVGVVAAPVVPCQTFSGQGTIRDVDTSLDLITGRRCDGAGQPTCASLAQTWPAGTTSVEFTAAFTALTGAISPGFGVDPYVAAYNAAGALITIGTSTTVVQGTNDTPGYVVHDLELVGSLGAATKAALLVNAAPSPSSNLVTATGQLNFNCNTRPPLVAPTCCTAIDPLTTATLNLILQRLDLIQRQIVPFSYVSGPVHSALSGTGTVSVQGILGVLLNVSVPSRAGDIIGTPDTRFDVGWINFGTVDGYSERIFIDGDSQVILPPTAGAWTLIGYTLLPGASMTLTELIREP